MLQAGAPTNSASDSSFARPLLTIAIPTYCRASCLRELLSCLGPQLLKEPRVELLISDNASTDDTPTIIADHLSLYPETRSIRNANNIGPDGNFVQCFQMAEGTYVWILSDDDIMVPGGLRALLALLEQNEYSLIYLDHFLLDGSTYPCRPSRLKTYTFRDPRRFAKTVGAYFTFISGNIVNKDLLPNAETSSHTSFIGSNLAQLSWIFSALDAGSRAPCLFVRSKLVGVRVDNTGGYKLADVFATNFRRITETSIHSARMKSALINALLQRFWPVHLIASSGGAQRFDDDRVQERSLRNAFGDYVWFWIFVYPILRLPRPIGVAWANVIRLVNRINKEFSFLFS